MGPPFLCYSQNRKAKLTQEEVSELIEVSTRYYQMLESKKPAAITIDTIERLAEAFKINPSQLLKF